MINYWQTVWLQLTQHRVQNQFLSSRLELSIKKHVNFTEFSFMAAAILSVLFLVNNNYLFINYLYLAINSNKCYHWGFWMWSPETRAWHHSCCGCWRFGWLRIRAAGPTESFYEASKCFQTLIVKPCCWNRCSMWFSTVLLKYAIPSLKTCLLNGTCLSALMVFFQMCNLPTPQTLMQPITIREAGSRGRVVHVQSISDFVDTVFFL